MKGHPSSCPKEDDGLFSASLPVQKPNLKTKNIYQWRIPCIIISPSSSINLNQGINHNYQFSCGHHTNATTWATSPESATYSDKKQVALSLGVLSSKLSQVNHLLTTTKIAVISRDWRNARKCRRDCLRYNDIYNKYIWIYSENSERYQDSCDDLYIYTDEVIYIYILVSI